MNVLSGITKPDAGRMEIDGVPYAPRDPVDAKRRGLAYIHQELSLFPHLSVAENIFCGNERAHLGWISIDAPLRGARELLKTFGHSEIEPDARVRDVSPAARQIVEICRALSREARILLLDEPTSSLEGRDVERLFATIRTLCAKGIAVIYISHFLEEVREIASRFVVLRDGKSVASGDLAGTTDEELIARMVGRAASSPAVPETRSPGDVVLRVDKLEARPGLSHASFELRRGEILGIAGLVGSGRTRLLRTLYGLEPATSGEVRIHGRTVRLSSWSPSRSIRAGIGYLSEDRAREGLFPQLPIAANLMLTRSSTRWGFIQSDVEAKDTETWVHRLRVKASRAGDPVRNLSGGNQQKVLLARLLHQDAHVLLLDEPTRGVDISSKAEIHDQVRRLADEGKAVLMTSSYLPELFGVCDRLAVMSNGALSPARPIDQWTADSVLSMAIGGESRAP